MESMYEHPAFSDIIANQERIMANSNAPEQTQQIHTQENDWVFNVPPQDLRNRRILLLTVMRIAVYAVWSGSLGEHYSAYDAKAQ